MTKLICLDYICTTRLPSDILISLPEFGNGTTAVAIQLGLRSYAAV